MTLVQRRGCLLQKNQVFKAFIGLSSYRLDHKDHKNSLELNKPSDKPLEAPANIVWYTKKDLEQIIQVVF